MKIDIITIFPEIFNSYFKESIIWRAQKKKLIEINVHDLRKWTEDKRKTTDDRPFGGGPGMVMRIEPIYRAVKELKKVKKKKEKTKIILFTPRGKKFNQKTAYKFSRTGHLILICGRYEGVDERVAEHIADVKLSIGDYVLMGGELPAMIVAEAVLRLIPKVLGKKEFIKERLSKEKGFVEYPQYTRPEVFNKWKVPKVLLSGDHKKIKQWREKRKKIVIS